MSTSTNKPPLTQPPRAGTSNSSLSDETAANNAPTGVTRDELNHFLEATYQAIAGRVGTDRLPVIEASREICEHYVKDKKSLDETRHFLFQGVMVIEKGFKSDVLRREKLTMEDINFAGQK